ncbi:MAG TPA: serine/threonine-protein kinase [Gemmataceae bacterium]|jgi:serine/threonine-protein kinase
MLVGQEFGPFTIDKELGSGAMGTVYRGRYTKTGQIMAIKVMAPGIGSTNAAAADRFEREITILKQLNHDNIVRFYGAGKQQKSRYFAMELIEGESLDKVMSRRGRMTWEEVVTLGQQLCSALQHAHEKGVIHRDLKPSNIMVLADGTLKLTDFGIAKAADLEALTQTNCTVGTASYMSPEQCKGQTDLTLKSDLYSLGVLFYELLTGRKPFKADNAMDMFMLHVNGTFERPSRLVFDIPIWLDTLVCQLLEKQPEKRPLDAQTVANTLGSIQEKVEAQQSAGVEAVRRRVMDRGTGQKRPDEEDKEAARILMTGRGRRRKQAKKRFYQKVWFQAVGLLLALGVVGTLLYLVFKPPSADKLYQQAQRVWKSGDAEVQDQAIEPNGAIFKYLKHYGSRNDERAKEVRVWDEQIKIEQKERQIVKYLQKQGTRGVFEPQDEMEKAAFAAAKAEDKGDREGASESWQKLKTYDSPIWSLVADRHLNDLQAFEAIDKRFQEHYDHIHASGKEQPLADPRGEQAFRAWRAEHSGIDDRLLARSLLGTLKEETAKERQQHFWYVYAAYNDKRLAGGEKQKKEKVLEDAEKHLHEAREEWEKKKMHSKDALLICLDILALYEEKDKKDGDVPSLVKEARKLRDEIRKQ